MNTHRIYVTRAIPQNGIDMLVQKGYEVVVGADTKPLKPGKLNTILSKAEKKGRGYDAVLTLLTDKIGVDILASAPRLKVVSNMAIGFDNIDVKGLSDKQVTVTNTPGDYCDTVAEHVVALTLSLVNNVVAGDRFMRKGRYVGWDPMLFVGKNISKQTIGIIGAGRIGERTAYHFKKGFDTDILYFDLKTNETLEQEYGAKKMPTIESLLEQSDVVTLHVPLLSSTRHMVNESFLKKMKKDAVLINTARGPVVDEMLLVKALKEKWIAGAALDVFEFEPKLAKGLAKLENVVLTPHIASASVYAREEMSRIAAQNIIDVLEGRTPVGLVRL